MSTSPKSVSRSVPAARPAARPAYSLVILAAALLIGCGGASPTTSPPAPSPSAASAEFDLAVLPELFVGRSVAGTRVILLVTISGSADDGPVDVSATGTGATITVEPARLSPGVVGEVTVVPDPVGDLANLDVVIVATRGDVRREVSRTLEVAEAAEFPRAPADAHLARFTPWLAANRPDLGITPETDWAWSPGSWVLIVHHHAYLSADWELELSWHEMIPPSDWVRINLRRRWAETKPSLAFEITSAQAGGDPIEIEPEPGIWR